MLVLKQDGESADETSRLDGRPSIEALLRYTRDRSRELRSDETYGGVDRSDEGGQERRRPRCALEDLEDAGPGVSPKASSAEEEERDGVDGQVDGERVEEGSQPSLNGVAMARFGTD